MTVTIISVDTLAENDDRIDKAAAIIFPVLYRGMRWEDRRIAWWRRSEARHFAREVLKAAEVLDDR